MSVRSTASSLLAAALFVSAPIALQPTTASAQSPRLSPETVTYIRTSGPYCAYLKARRGLSASNQVYGFLAREACFPTRAQCKNWFYWAQSHFDDHLFRRPCSRG